MHYYPHFIHEETEPQSLINLHKVPWLGDTVYLIGFMYKFCELFVNVLFQVVSLRPSCVTGWGTMGCSPPGERPPSAA